MYHLGDPDSWIPVKKEKKQTLEEMEDRMVICSKAYSHTFDALLKRFWFRGVSAVFEGPLIGFMHSNAQPNITIFLEY